MRIVYRILIALMCIGLWLGVQQWRGPELAALTVELKPLELRIVASGEVRSQMLARIGSEITGTVLARHVREGDRVNQGDLLIELNPQEAQARLAQAQTLLQQLQTVTRPQAQTALVEATYNFNQARREAQRRKILADKGTISVEQAEQAQQLQRNAKTILTRAQLTATSLAAKGSEERLLLQRVASAEAELAKTRIYAPFAGRVQTRNVEAGDLVQPSKVLLELARDNTQHKPTGVNDSLEVIVALDEKNFAPLQLHQPVQLIADAWPEQTLSGEVSFIAPAVDSGRGTIDVHISIKTDSQEPQPSLLQGMTVSANIIAAERDAALVLPNDYLQPLSSAGASSKRAQVMRWQNGKLHAVSVTLGLRNMTHSEVVSGLEEGDVVVQADTLDDGQRVRVRFEDAPHVIR